MRTPFPAPSRTPRLKRWAKTAASGLLACSSLGASVALLSASLATSAQAADAEYAQRFLTQYNKIKNPANGYFSPEGVPYHSVETLMVEAPDHGHETTSEAYSFWLWLEAQYGRATGDWQPLKKAWANMEKYIIPSTQDQPTNSFYNPGRPATYAAEHPLPENYPSRIDSSVPVGQDPLANELAAAYGTREIYGMHWLLDVDNWYGFGRCGDGVTKPAYINTFQRGAQESVWETVPHPSCETFKWGRNTGNQGFLSLFTGDSSYARQWRYTNAPDADARAVQAIYWASVWAKEQGKGAEVADLVKKASKMGDYLRYAMFDKYFKKVGNCVGAYNCQGGSGTPDARGFRDNQHYLLSWYYAWGGAVDQGAGWAWRISSSHAHFGYQNPFAAWVLSSQPEFKPVSATGASDWGKSLTRQVEFYRWLQSADGAIAGGATNSWGGNHGTPPAGTATFYGMFYDEKPVYHDPASNTWFGFQVWSMQRVAEYYYATGDAKAKALLDKWVGWALANTTLKDDGTYRIPNTLKWSGQPDTWNPDSPGANSGLRVSVVDHTNDVGTAAAFARTLIYYSAKANHAASKAMAKQLLDRMWTKHQDAKGVAVEEERTDYKRFDDKFNPATGDGIFVPQGWVGTNAQGATIDSNSTFLSIRPKYEQDPQWPKLKAYLDGGPSPKWTYHRFWAQADIALAMADYAHLLDGTGGTAAVKVNNTALRVPEGGNARFFVTLSQAPASNVTVTVAKAAGGDADLNASRTTLGFTPANYNVAQPVYVQAAEDEDQANGSAAFTVSAPGHTAVRVSATELDNDVVVPVTLVLSGTPVAVPEGGTRSFQARLAAKPAGNVTVQVARTGGDADLSVASGATLTFTPANWNVNQAVTLAAAEDADGSNGSATFSLSGSGGLSATVQASEQDNDAVAAACTVVFDASSDWGSGQTQAITLQNGSASAIEGWSVSWTAASDFQVTNSWNSTVTQSGRTVVAKPTAWNATVPANGSVSFGVQVAYSGSKPTPSAVKWEGRDCKVVVK
ncbi:glycoside hydrolase family 48 protein [Eleftheria terrae]|uniref:glycoside hydrolase family 48 protein n=1 Tax=Eleftheria terrae TaxID=1597781 RepID=UPI00263A40C0|nr:glycoside hydrolase family 48 protein [Eleftheria terrae]WKB54996.1 cellulose binding domain-containing protein [Eleftheria terrae]